MRRPRRATARSTPHRGALALLLLALLLPAAGWLRPTATAAQASGVTIAAEANFGGNHQADAWVPITVQLANAGPDVTGDVIAEAVVAGPQGNARYSQRVELPTRSRKALTLYALVPAFPTTLDVSFTTGRDTVAAPRVQLRPLKQGQQLIGVLGDDEQAGGALARALLGAYGGNVEAITARPAELPDNPYGLGSFSSLVLRDAATDRWSADQRQALAGWVARGGRLVVVGGPAWRPTGEGLGELPPVRFADSRAADGLPALAAELGLAAAPAGGFVLATGDVLQGATRLAEQDGVPLVVERGWGRGTVTALAFDPASPAFLGWDGAGAFWKRLGLDAPLPVSLQEPFLMSGRGTFPGQGGYRLGGVLRDLPTLGFPPVWAVGLVILLFILAVGPLNYLLLRRLDRRELAWVTIPALTLLLTGGIYAYGTGLKGRTTVVNTVSIVRILPGGRAADLQSFFAVFTPSRGVRQLPVGHGALLTGFSLGNRGPGGLGNSDLGASLRFEQGEQAAARDASFAQWTLRAVAAQAAIDPAPLMLRLDLRPDGARVVGRITNESGRAVEDVTLLLDGAYERLGNLAPGAGVEVTWTPSVRYGTGGPTYGPGPPGLGAALYSSGPGRGPYYYGPGRPYLGPTGRRAEVLDALSGSVLSGGAAVPYHPPPPYGPPTPTPSPTPTPPVAAGPPATGGRSGSGPLQVLFWQAETPLPLLVGGEEAGPTTLIIQEVYLGPGAQSQDRPAPGESDMAGAGR